MIDSLTTLIEMHEVAQQNSIDVYYFPLKDAYSICIETDDVNPSIGLQATLTEAKETESMAHEIAHIQEGLPSNKASKMVRDIHETRAHRRSAEMLITWEAYQRAMTDPWNDNEWSQAEYFNVSVETLRWAIKGFQYRGLLEW